MSETAALPASPSANAEEIATLRATLSSPAMLNSGVRRASQHNTRHVPSIADCCGSRVVDKDGCVYLYGDAIPVNDYEAVLTAIKKHMAHDNHSYQVEFSRKVHRGDKTGVFFGIGISKGNLISACYSQNSPLYGKVEGIEFNDPDEGLISIIWTNA